MYPKLKGFVPPLVTPVMENGELDAHLLKRLAQRVVDAGASAVFALGTSAEFSLLGEEQQKRVVATIVEALGNKVPVVVGISDTGPTKVIQRLTWVQKAGAAAIVVCPPFYFPFTQEEIRRFYYDVLNASDLPLILYNIPNLAHNHLGVELVAELAANPQVLGIKDSGGDFAYFQRLLTAVKAVRSDFAVMQGRECLSAASLLMGADGLVPGLGNLAPELCMQLLRSAQAGDIKTSRQLQARLTGLEGIYDVGSKAIAGLKAAMTLTGWGTPWPIQPNTPVDDQGIARVREILAQYWPDGTMVA